MLDALEIALARQPIFDRDDKLVGYELLYRRHRTETVAVQPEQGSGTQMSSDTITGAFVGLGVERVTGGKRAFINLDRALLLSGAAYVLDPKAVVLEILESVRPDDEVVAAAKRSSRGDTRSHSTISFMSRHTMLSFASRKS
jgi:EAL and modified HD-GYP domain-containing signal transduction protein